MAALTEWLRLMLDEIARKREDAKQAAAEVVRRDPTTPAPVHYQAQGQACDAKHATVGK